MEKLYLTIDTKTLKNSPNPEDMTVYLNKELEEHYTKISLKNIHIRSSTEWIVEGGENLFRVQCSILNQDDNLLSGQKSDVLALLFCRFLSNRYVICKLGNNGIKLIKKHSNNIRMYLTDDSNNIVKLSSNFVIIYELEVS